MTSVVTPDRRAEQQQQAKPSSGLSDIMGDFATEQMEQPLRDPADTTENAAPDAETGQVQHSGELSWAELNKASRRKAAMYASAAPGSIVLLMLFAAKPILRLLVRFIGLSSKAFDRQQESRTLAGEPRTYRVLEVAMGRPLGTFDRELTALMHSPCTLLPAAKSTLSMRGLLFRMLSRCAGAVHQLLRVSHQGCPYRLFKALEGCAYEVSNIPFCLRDPLTRHILETYEDDYSMLQGEEAQHILSSIAHVLSLDVLEIEARHSSARRLITVRSVQTWRLSMCQLNADWYTRQLVIEREPWTPVQSSVVSKKKKRKRALSAQPPVRKDGAPKLRRKGRPGGGGAWRAARS